MAKKPKLTPIGGNILVKPLAEEIKTAAGIVLPDTVSKEKPQKGEVVALGTGRLDDSGKKVAFNVKVGDVVIFKKYGPDEIEVEGEDYLIMEESDILAITA
jgi:chaperonin GroES